MDTGPILLQERLPIEETRKAVTVLDRHGIPVGAVVVNRVLPEAADGGFVERRRERERGYLDEIDALFPDHPVFRVPLMETDVQGIEALRRVIGALPSAERGRKQRPGS